MNRFLIEVRKQVVDFNEVPSGYFRDAVGAIKPNINDIASANKRRALVDNIGMTYFLL